jgi:hypothetical protein
VSTREDASDAEPCCRGLVAGQMDNTVYRRGIRRDWGLVGLGINAVAPSWALTRPLVHNISVYVPNSRASFSSNRIQQPHFA